MAAGAEQTWLGKEPWLEAKPEADVVSTHVVVHSELHQERFTNVDNRCGLTDRPGFAKVILSAKFRTPLFAHPVRQRGGDRVAANGSFDRPQTNIQIPAAGATQIGTDTDGAQTLTEEISVPV